MHNILFITNIGVGINADGVGLLSNNSILTANENGTVPMIQCISSTTVPNIGQWIAPNGEDITYGSVTDPFDVTVGDSNNPGVVIIAPSSGHFLTSSFDGVYTCSIPDKSGMVKNIHIGIYPYDFSSKCCTYASNLSQPSLSFSQPFLPFCHLGSLPQAVPSSHSAVCLLLHLLLS